MSVKCSKPLLEAAAATEAKAFVEARDRARARIDPPGGGDAFFKNHEIAQKHLARLHRLVGVKRAAALIAAEEKKGMRYVFEPGQPSAPALAWHSCRPDEARAGASL